MKTPSRAEANARLTSLSGIVVLVLMVAELATVVLGARSVLSLVASVGPLGSTCGRAAQAHPGLQY